MRVAHPVGPGAVGDEEQAAPRVDRQRGEGGVGPQRGCREAGEREAALVDGVPAQDRRRVSLVAGVEDPQTALGVGLQGGEPGEGPGDHAARIRLQPAAGADLEELHLRVAQRMERDEDPLPDHRHRARPFGQLGHGLEHRRRRDASKGPEEDGGRPEHAVPRLA